MRFALVLAVLAAAVPAAAQGDTPITAARFSISIDGVQLMSFQELEGISSSVDVVDFMERDKHVRRFDVDGLVMLKRPLTGSLELSKWHQEAVANGPRVRKNMVLIIHGTDDKPVARYHLEQAWPAKIEIGALKAGSSEVLMETITIACERIERVSP